MNEEAEEAVAKSGARSAAQRSRAKDLKPTKPTASYNQYPHCMLTHTSQLSEDTAKLNPPSKGIW